MFKTIEKNAQGIFIEKKSKFIANVFEVSSTKEAEENIEKIRKEYHDARHNCFAYRILEENSIVEKQSDDGEPSGTAGAPMLNILKKKELTNVIAIVTRYFGGILLGTGGLVRAYSEALTKALEESKVVKKEKGYVIEIISEYDKQKEFDYFCEKNKINIISKEYTDKIKYLIEISEENYVEKIQKMANDKFHNLPIKIKEKKHIITNE